MDKKTIIHTDPKRIPVPGNKLIEEFVGQASTGQSDISVAHMVAPPEWSEPWQQPQFDEYTIVVKGQLQIETREQTWIAKAGQVVQSPAGAAIRYSNPFKQKCEYWAICKPAFKAEDANRIDDES